MRVDSQTQVGGGRAHFNCKYAFGNELSGTGSDDPNAEDAFSLWIDDQFRHTFRSVERDGAAGGAPWVLRDLVFATLLFGLSLSEAGPGDFRIGENNRGNCIGLEGDLMAGNRFGGGAALMRC